MAFGKKKGDEAAAVVIEADDDAPLFPDEDAEAEVASADAEPATAEAPVDPPAAEAPAAEDAVPATDALLSAFQTAEGAEEDRSVLLDLAGDVELADILEELNTLAAAIGIARA